MSLSQNSPSYSEPACDSALIQRRPGMTRDDCEEFMSGLAGYCKAYGCRLVEFLPEEILEREAERCSRTDRGGESPGSSFQCPERVVSVTSSIREELEGLNPSAPTTLGIMVDDRTQVALVSERGDARTNFPVEQSAGTERRRQQCTEKLVPVVVKNPETTPTLTNLAAVIEGGMSRETALVGIPIGGNIGIESVVPSDLEPQPLTLSNPQQSPRNNEGRADCIPHAVCPPRFFMWRVCSRCGLNYGAIECSAQDHGKSSHGLCSFHQAEAALGFRELKQFRPVPQPTPANA